MKILIVFLLLFSCARAQQNTASFSMTVENLPCNFYCTGNNWQFENVNFVHIDGDTMQNIRALNLYFSIQDRDYFFLLDIRDIIVKNGFTKTNQYTAAKKQYDDFHDLHQPLYDATYGNLPQRLIKLYKNYMIRSTEAKYLRDIIDALNDHYNIKAKYQPEYLGYITAYNNYHAGK